MKQVGASSGFDYLRIVLATGVLIWHTLPLTQGADAAGVFMTSWKAPIVAIILPMFFALSGFLVSASLERNTLKTFLVFRGLRILPALTVEIALSALVLGPIVSAVGIHAYFHDSQFYMYFFNAIGWIHYRLPGVFSGNPYASIVNGSLWTVPFEIECYVALTFLAVFSLTRSYKTLLFSIFAGAGFVAAMSYGKGYHGANIDPVTLDRTLILCFLAGAFFNAARNIIRCSSLLFIVSLALALLILSVPELYPLAPLPCAYVTIWIGLRNFRKAPILFAGDYSYGMYLYAFPIAQTVIYAFPDHREFWFVLPVTLIAVFGFAVFSWHVIEKPTLKLKRVFFRRPEQAPAGKVGGATAVV